MRKALHPRAKDAAVLATDILTENFAASQGLALLSTSAFTQTLERQDHEILQVNHLTPRTVRCIFPDAATARGGNRRQSS